MSAHLYSSTCSCAVCTSKRAEIQHSDCGCDGENHQHSAQDTAPACGCNSEHHISEPVDKLTFEVNCDCGGEHTHARTTSPKTKYLIFGISLALILGGILLPIPRLAKNILYIGAFLINGFPTLRAAAKNLIKGKVFDENFLMSIATIGAFFLGEFMEAALVMFLFNLGETLQDSATDKSLRRVEELMDIRPEYANLKTGDSVSRVSPGSVEVGNIIMVNPGERIPLDGVVVKGHSFIDTSALTGESEPVGVEVGMELLSGCINQMGLLEVEVTRPYSQSAVAKILDLIQHANEKKAKSENFITKFARVYTPIVVLIAVLVAVVPPLFGLGAFVDWIYKALSFLLVSCPCALVISIPITYISGIGGSAKNGILIKGGNYLDTLANVDTAVFDKTGTLTKGNFEVADILPADGIEADALIRYTAIAEQNSHHPIAKHIASLYDAEQEPIDEYSELAGLGIRCISNGTEILAGNYKLMQHYSIDCPVSDAVGTVVYTAVGGVFFGRILIRDSIRPTTPEAIAALRKLGIQKTIMLTGDNVQTAAAVAEEAGIDQYYAGLLPQDKTARLEEIMAGSKKNTLYVGDGMNDAPVLALADVGIAMGEKGVDAAIESADCVILKDDLSALVTAVKGAKKTHRVATENIIFVLGIKFAIMVLTLFGVTGMLTAIFADVGIADCFAECRTGTQDYRVEKFSINCKNEF